MEAVGGNSPLSGQNAREKLATSAAALFQRFGYAAVSIRDITFSVDIPKGAFYNYFSGKEALASTREDKLGITAYDSRLTVFWGDLTAEKSKSTKRG